jgi:hypothetical protein
MYEMNCVAMAYADVSNNTIITCPIPAYHNSHECLPCHSVIVKLAVVHRVGAVAAASVFDLYILLLVCGIHFEQVRYRKEGKKERIFGGRAEKARGYNTNESATHTRNGEPRCFQT